MLMFAKNQETASMGCDFKPHRASHPFDMFVACHPNSATNTFFLWVEPFSLDPTGAVLITGTFLFGSVASYVGRL